MWVAVLIYALGLLQPRNTVSIVPIFTFDVLCKKGKNYNKG
jgi:hypothetical protein